MIDIARIESSVEKHADQFLNRIFTPHEQQYATSKAKTMSSLALRFAAKEAFSKALGSGLADGLKWTDVEVRNDARGAPSLRLYGRAKEKTAGCQVHLTLSDTDDTALAFVVIEKV